MDGIGKYSTLLGRVLISAMFLISGVGKVTVYQGAQGYMESMGVPGILLPLAILTEIAGALFLIVGFQTRITAFILSGFTVVTALIFHSNFADEMQTIMFMKDISIAGGLLILSVHDAGLFSIDNQLATNHNFSRY